jgi:hypothetical protein
MTEQSNEFTGRRAEGPEQKEGAKPNRRRFAQGLATALGLTAVVAGAPAVGASGKPSEEVKSRILERIQKDLTASEADADCYDRGPAGDHYLKGDCPGPILPIDSVRVK